MVTTFPKPGCGLLVEVSGPFLDVEGNRSDSAYQLWQGILAFGAGGIHGVGLGSGRQQMSFLPPSLPWNSNYFPFLNSIISANHDKVKEF